MITGSWGAIFRVRDKYNEGWCVTSHYISIPHRGIGLDGVLCDVTLHHTTSFMKGAGKCCVQALQYISKRGKSGAGIAVAVLGW